MAGFVRWGSNYRWEVYECGISIPLEAFVSLNLADAGSC